MAWPKLPSVNLNTLYEKHEAIDAAEYNKTLSEGLNKKFRNILGAEPLISMEKDRYGYNGQRINTANMRVSAKAGQLFERIAKEFENALMGFELDYVNVEMVEWIPISY